MGASLPGDTPMSLWMADALLGQPALPPGLRGAGGCQAGASQAQGRGVGGSQAAPLPPRQPGAPALLGARLGGSNLVFLSLSHRGGSAERPANQKSPSAARKPKLPLRVW